MKVRFSELIRREENVLAQLLPFSARQLEIVRGGDTSLLLQFLGRKQSLMDEFESIENELASFQDIPWKERLWTDDREQAETKRAIDRCAALMEKILENDRQSTDELAVEITELQEQIRRIRMSSQAPLVYAKQNAEQGTVRRFQADS